MTLGVDQFNKIIFNQQESFLEHNLNNFYGNDEVQMALPFIHNPEIATRNTLLILSAGSGGVKSINSVYRGSGDASDVLGSASLIKDLNQ